MNLLGAIESLGRHAMSNLDTFGDQCRFGGRSMLAVASVARRPRTISRLIPQLYQIGARSVFVLMVTGGFVGMVLAVQVALQLKPTGMIERMGSVVYLSVLRELGPVLAAVVLAGRVGGGMTAELGTMRVTEQIDALRAMGTDPIRVLVVPRFLACVLLIPIMVLYASFMGIMGGYVISVFLYHVPLAEFWRYATDQVHFFDLIYGPIKSVFFGSAIGLISCYEGFHCELGAAGVGRACTRAFVSCFLAIMVMDLFLGMFLNTFQELWFGLSRGL